MKTRPDYSGRDEAFHGRVLHVALSWFLPKINFPMHPSDRGTAVEMFKILRDGGLRYSAEDVAEWLTTEKGLDAVLAESIVSIARQVLARKRVRVGDKGHKGSYWIKGVLNLWVEEAERAS